MHGWWVSSKVQQKLRPQLWCDRWANIYMSISGQIKAKPRRHMTFIPWSRWKGLVLMTATQTTHYSTWYNGNAAPSQVHVLWTDHPGSVLCSQILAPSHKEFRLINLSSYEDFKNNYSMSANFWSFIGDSKVLSDWSYITLKEFWRLLITFPIGKVFRNHGI